MTNKAPKWTGPIGNLVVKDGDTFGGVVWATPFEFAPHLRMSMDVAVRVRWIDTPEKSTEAGRLVAEVVRREFAFGTVSVACYGLDKYDRLLCDASVDGVDLGKWLLDNGLADFYDGGQRSWPPEGLESVAMRAREILG